jgi:hypothetical protein
MDYRQYTVSEHQKQPLLEFLLSALQQCGCQILHHSGAKTAPFRITFEAPDGERLGIVVYAFFANRKETSGRPSDEHRFQVKYGPKTPELHRIWQDPFELYTTIFIGINPEMGFFVGADPEMHNPTRFFISVEFKDQHVSEILRSGWHSWERQKRTPSGLEEPVEIMVGGLPEYLLSYVRYERAAKGLSAGHRALLADKVRELRDLRPAEGPAPLMVPPADTVHELSKEFALTHAEIMDLIQSAPRLKMAVRGWVAEAHLERQLGSIKAITECKRIEEEGQADFRVSLRGSRPIFIECKNVLRKPYADGSYRMDFQRTRASLGDPCSRYYSPEDFDVVAACLHPMSENWDFSFAITKGLDPHKHCAGRLSNLVRIDDRWSQDVVVTIERALAQ